MGCNPISIPKITNFAMPIHIYQSPYNDQRCYLNFNIWLGDVLNYAYNNSCKLRISCKINIAALILGNLPNSQKIGISYLKTWKVESTEQSSTAIHIWTKFKVKIIWKKKPVTTNNKRPFILHFSWIVDELSCNWDNIHPKTTFWNNISWLSDGLTSFWPSDAIWQHISGSTLIQVMACCWTAPSNRQISQIP